MSIPLGDTVTLTQLVRDSAGALANATSVALTITLPDGTSSTPTVTSPPTVTGTYTYTYTPSVQGLHGIRRVFTGSNAQAPRVDSLYVETPTAVPLVSLAEVREQCRASATTDDDRLLWHALVASGICEDHTQVWRRTTITSVHDGGRRWLQLRAPVASVTSVTEDGAAVASTGYVLRGDLGWLYRGTETSAEYWAAGAQNIDVTYVAGASDGVVPPGIRQGVLLQAQHLWDSQRGGSPLPRQAGSDFAHDPRTGYSIPHRVLQLWRSSMAGVLVG